MLQAALLLQQTPVVCASRPAQKSRTSIVQMLNTPSQQHAHIARFHVLAAFTPLHAESQRSRR